MIVKGRTSGSVFVDIGYSDYEYYKERLITAIADARNIIEFCNIALIEKHIEISQYDGKKITRLKNKVEKIYNILETTLPIIREDYPQVFRTKS